MNLAWKVIHQQYKLELEWRGFSTRKRDFWVVWRSPPSMLHIVFAKSFLFIKRIIGRDHSASVLFSITSKYRYIYPVLESYFWDFRHSSTSSANFDVRHFFKKPLHLKWITCLKYFLIVLFFLIFTIYKNKL